MELCLEGKTNKQIAQELMLSPRAVSYIIHSPVFEDKIYIRRGHRQMEHDLATSTVRIPRHFSDLDTLEKKLDNPNPRIQLAAAKKILDRVGI
ncbi:hypothetical protein LCGC14_3147490 [marine sediment metagenome]|uniref:HTH luxR-type domain-containing protein n=1 Tax=marine sediment metagenome TaxID=412755 RepID=A0A0F8VV24_9ZZZZ